MYKFVRAWQRTTCNRNVGDIQCVEILCFIQWMDLDSSKCSQCKFQVSATVTLAVFKSTRTVKMAMLWITATTKKKKKKWTKKTRHLMKKHASNGAMGDKDENKKQSTKQTAIVSCSFFHYRTRRLDSTFSVFSSSPVIRFFVCLCVGERERLLADLCT